MIKGAIPNLAWKSILARKTTAFLTVLAVALSVALFVGVEKTRHSARSSFENTISGVDAIVGARTGPINLLLFSVFRIGDATSPMSWESFEAIQARPDVAWAIPIALGDSHRGYKVLGTETSYFEHYKYGQKQPLELAAGGVFNPHKLEVVLGSDVAQNLGYPLGHKIILSHGIGEVSFQNHDDHPFEVVGILKPTGTPVDQTIHISLEGMEAMHAPAPLKSDGNHDHANHDDHSDHHAHTEEMEHKQHNHNDAHDHHQSHDHETHDHDAHNHEGHDNHEAHNDHHDHHDHNNEAVHSGDHSDDASHEDEHHHEADIHDNHDHQHLEPNTINAAFIGLTSRPAVLRFNREVNTYENEALLSIIPGMTLSSLWSIVGSAEKALLATSAFVVIVGISTILITIFTSLKERRREMAILRSIGARPSDIFALIISEAALLALCGSVIGVGFIQSLLLFVAPLINAQLGLSLSGLQPGLFEVIVIVVVVVLTAIMAFWPAFRATKNSLADGLTIKV